jgi:hypothetical protein
MLEEHFQKLCKESTKEYTISDVFVFRDLKYINEIFL